MEMLDKSSKNAESFNGQLVALGILGFEEEWNWNSFTLELWAHFIVNHLNNALTFRSALINNEKVTIWNLATFRENDSNKEELSTSSEMDIIRSLIWKHHIFKI